MYEKQPVNIQLRECKTKPIKNNKYESIDVAIKCHPGKAIKKVMKSF
jgi:hypothetical protein